MTPGEMAGRRPSPAMMRALRFLAWEPGDPDITAPRVDSFYACARRGLITDMDRRWHITHAGREALRALDAGGGK